jgi:hypothetical protein
VTSGSQIRIQWPREGVGRRSSYSDSSREMPRKEQRVYVGPGKLILMFDGRPVTTIVFFAVGPAEFSMAT